MKRNALKGTGTVFRFTLADLCMSKGWLISTISLVVILLFGIPALMSLFMNVSEETAEEEMLSKVYICDETAGEVDYSYLTALGYADASYEAYASVDAAKSAIENPNETLVVQISNPEEEIAYNVTVYLPDETTMSRSAANGYASFFVEHFDTAKQQKANASAEMAAMLSTEINTYTDVLDAEGNPVTSDNAAEELLLFMVPFIVLMVIYMMVLMYGQQLGNSILLEKSNKLMDTMLISIHPAAMMFGKMAAIVSSAVLQFVLWIFAALGGISSGFTFVASTILGGGAATGTEAAAAPSASSALMLEIMSGEKYFTLGGIAWTFLIIVVGFVLYLSLAAISGALSATPEDLGKMNIIFVLALVISFVLTLTTPGSMVNEASVVSDAAWLKFFPFTAMLVMPGKLLVGDFTHLEAFLATLSILVTAILFVFIAATLYRLLVLYRGNPPTPKMILSMLKDAKLTAQTAEASAQDTSANE